MEKPKILVIDDEEIVRVSCMKCLTPEGYSVTVAGNGREGLNMAASQHFDLILTDLKMPDIDGMEFMIKMRQEQPGTKIIMITGYSTVELAEEALRAGAAHYIEKPFTPDALISAVKEVLAPAKE